MMNFINDESGAVTIDWVALAAGLLILGVGIIALIDDEVSDLTDRIQSELTTATNVTAGTDS